MRDIQKCGQGDREGKMKEEEGGNKVGNEHSSPREKDN